MWLGSKLFAAGRGIAYEALKKSCFRAFLNDKKICVLKSHILVFMYVCGVGRSGKILKIWSEAFESKERAEAFLRAYEKALSEGMSEVEFEAWAWGVSEAEIKAVLVPC